MRTMNNLFLGIFLLIAVIALFSALFAGATWHYATAIMGLVLSWLFYSDNKSLKTKRS